MMMVEAFICHVAGHGGNTHGPDPPSLPHWAATSATCKAARASGRKEACFGEARMLNVVPSIVDVLVYVLRNYPRFVSVPSAVARGTFLSTE
jgi:hypothetical protein